MSTPAKSVVQPVAEAQWVVVITYSLQERGQPTQVMPAHTDPESAEAKLVGWNSGDSTFSYQKIRGRTEVGLVATIHNPNYPGADQA